MVSAGGQSQQAVAVFDPDAGVVALVFRDKIHIFVECGLIFGVNEPVITEALLVLIEHPGIEGGDNLISSLLINGVKLDELMVFPIGLGREIIQIAEHGAALHVVAVYDQVVRFPNVAGLVQIKGSAVGIVAVKINMQVFVRLVRRVHDHVVNRRSLYFEPADGIGVFRREGGVLFQNLRNRGGRRLRKG